MTNFEKTLFAIDKLCKKRSIEYAVIGGVAAIIYKLPRTTEDIDITLLTDIGEIREIGKTFMESFSPLQENPLDFFERYFILPSIYEKTKIKVDFAAGVSGFDKKVIQRKKRAKFGQVNIWVCTIEDLIIYKLVASRSRDLVDIEHLFENNPKVDKEYLLKVAKQFIDLERGDIFEKLNHYLKQFNL